MILISIWDYIVAVPCAVCAAFFIVLGLMRQARIGEVALGCLVPVSLLAALWASFQLRDYAHRPLPARDYGQPMVYVYTYPRFLVDGIERMMILKRGDRAEMRRDGVSTIITLNGDVWLSTTLPVKRLPDMPPKGFE